MATFQYIAMDAQGKEQKGTVDAADRAQAIAAVRAAGLFPSAIGEVKSAAPAAAGKKPAAKKAAAPAKKGGSLNKDIKINIGDVYEHKKPGYMKVTGRSLTEGYQKEVLISSREMIEALCEPITAILDSICSVVEQTPPELVGDILQKGMVLTGGGSLLRGLDKLIERVTGIPAYVAKKPISSTVLVARP